MEIERPHISRDPENNEVRPLELFFDLVFAFAISQLSQHLVKHLNWTGAAQTAILLLAVFSVWSYTSWISSLADTEHGRVRWMLLAITFLGLFMNGGLADAFEQKAWLFVGAYLIIQIGRNIYALTLGLDKVMYEHHGRTLVWSIATGAIWIAGALAPDTLRVAIWGAAAIIELSGFLSAHPLPRRRTVTRDYPFAAGHLIERCRLFFLIAIGETILTTGTALVGSSVDFITVLATAVALIGTMAIWWIYFRRAEGVAFESLKDSRDQARIGRYAVYALLGMVGGLIATAVGDQSSIAHPLGQTNIATNVMLYGGPALFLLAQSWYLRTATGVVHRSRLVTTIILAALAAGTLSLPVVVTAALAAAVLVGLAVADSVQARREGNRDEIANH